MRFELFISRRYFKSKPKRTILSMITLLSIIGVAIGVTALIVVIGVMSGFESDLKSRIMGIEAHLIIDRDERPLDDYGKIVALAEQTPGVQSAWPVEELQVMLRSDARVSGALIKGVDPAAAAKGLQLQSLNKLLPAADAPSDPASAQLPPMIMGRDLARNLGLVQGDTVYVVSPKGSLAPVGFVPYMKRFVVVDFFQTGMYEYDGSLAFLRLEDAQALSHARGTASAVEIRVRRIFDTAVMGRRIVAQLGETYRFRDWMQLNKNLFSALKLEKAAMFITLTLITLVATFSITSSLVMLVLEKIKAIAILRTMGATAKSIKWIFVMQGLLIGMIGTGTGVILGTGLCYLQRAYKLIRLPGDVYYITALPIDLKLTDVAIVAVSALLICFLATLYPAQQASRFDPVEVIRYG
ncbi:MAG: ABC transporter permease [Desulfatitalea sp. BRH_c12]|nr:MAG: ABC transporter permease [Desulfatitalea sp. BRH_c12]